jgi:predicted AAA+ superfamily ATPase
MKYINRDLESIIDKYLQPGKVLILLGARRTGKTMLVKELVKKYSAKSIYLNAEDYTTQQILESRNLTNFKNLFAGKSLLVIDEAQVIRDIGKILKLIVDEIPEIKVIATGSSAFDIMNISGEPLTGRSYQFNLYPIAQMELVKTETLIESSQRLEERLIFGSYPEILQITGTEEKKLYLINLVSTYLFKDILAIEGLRNSDKIKDLIKLLAFQTGEEVSNYELGKQLGMSKNTVEKYLDLLSKVFIIFQLKSYSRNLRKEISKSSKWYFYDNGVRNTIISNFNTLSLRSDTGKLWENYIVSEMMKKNHYKLNFNNYYFWRTYDQQEIDLVEEDNSNLSAFEIKWTEDKFKIPKAWKEAYPESSVSIINRNNYLEYIT